MPPASRARYNLADMLGKVRVNIFRVVMAAGLAAIVAAGAAPSAAHRRRNAAQAVPPQPAAASSRPLVDRYCVSCHNERLKSGELVLAGVDLSDAAHNAPIMEKVARKLRGGTMPPEGRPASGQGHARRVRRGARDGAGSRMRRPRPIPDASRRAG